MLTPTGVSRADYSAAVMSGAAQHARMVFDNGVTLTEQDMESGGLVIRDILNGDTNLTFGRAVMKEFSVNLLNSDRLNGVAWTGEFTLDIGVEISGSTNWVTIGKFQGSRPEKIHYVDVIQFTAHDRMQRFTGDAGKFLDSLAYPITFGSMLYALCAFEGVPYSIFGDELADIKNRSFEKGFIRPEGITTRDLLALMAEACGCYARINADGQMEMMWYQGYGYSITPSMEIGIDTYDLGSGELWDDLGEGTWADAADKTWNETGGYQAVFSVDGLRSIASETDIGVAFGSLNGNVYTIVDNPFLVISEDTDKGYVEDLWDRIQAFGGYLPMHLECAGNWLVEAGDIVTVDVRGDSVSMPVFVKETAWNAGCIDRMEATGEIGRPLYSNEVSQKLSQGGKFHEYRNDLDGLASRVGNAEGNITELEQTAEGLTTRVADAEGDITTLEQTTSGLVTRVTDAEGDITTLEQTAQGLGVEVSRKARVYYSGTAPTGTADDPLETGDLWIDTANANQMKRWSGSAWVDVSFDDPDKYTVRSGIDITAAGVEVTGGKYVKIQSGGTFDVDATNFKISSTDKEMISGNWSFNDNGSVFESDISGTAEKVSFGVGRPASNIDNSKYSCGLCYEYSYIVVGGVPQYAANIVFYSYNKGTNTMKKFPILFTPLGQNVYLGDPQNSGNYSPFVIYAKDIHCTDAEVNGIFTNGLTWNQLKGTLT